MHSSSVSDGSLYELVLQGKSLLPTMQVSPTTLKSMCDSLVGLLIEQEIPVILWAKLPRGGVWWTELERYASLNHTAKAQYWFRNQREESDDSGEGNPVLERGMSISTVDVSGSPAPVFSIHLGADSPLRRDYFLMVWSVQFCGAILATRAPVTPAPPPVGNDTASLAMLSSYGQTAQLLDLPTPNRKQMLMAAFSFDRGLFQQVLERLERSSAVQPTSPDQLAIAPDASADLAPHNLVEHWQSLLAELPPEVPNMDLMATLLSKHIQHEDDLFQRSSAYRKQAESADSLRIQNEDLLNTLRLKDDFLNTVGQELRTPLTTIKTALTLLGSNSIKPPQRQRYMDLIAKECDRQSSLITSLLDLVHLEQVVEHAALPALQINEVVTGVVGTYLPLAEEKGVRLGYTLPETLPPVSCMANWLKQIMINLLHNGIKFTPSGGQVWVRTKRQGDYVQLEVSDTGIGISPSEIPKIFDRFYRVRQAADDSSGAGLGLTIVQQLLLHCGGSVSVKSRVGEGATFNVLLPIHRHPSSEPPI